MSSGATSQTETSPVICIHTKSVNAILANNPLLVCKNKNDKQKRLAKNTNASNGM